MKQLPNNFAVQVPEEKGRLWSYYVDWLQREVGQIGEYFNAGSWLGVVRGHVYSWEKIEFMRPELRRMTLLEWIACILENQSSDGILKEADDLITGDRAEDYGDAKEMFGSIAKCWSVIAGKEITPKQVSLMMIQLKVCRENHKSKRDNLIDIAGYAALSEKL